MSEKETPKSYVDSLMESEDMQAFVENHNELIEEAVSATYDYGKTLKAFVLENFEEFVGATLEETYKNIRLFTEVATMTFINEAVHAQAALIPDQEDLQEGGINDYL
jgi:hypothetical protein